MYKYSKLEFNTQISKINATKTIYQIERNLWKSKFFLIQNILISNIKNAQKVTNI